MMCKKKRFQGIKLKDWDTEPKKLRNRSRKNNCVAFKLRK